jgi:hypothetical protein
MRNYSSPPFRRSVNVPITVVGIGLLKSGPCGTRPESDLRIFRAMAGLYIAVTGYLNDPKDCLDINIAESKKRNIC